MLSECASAGLTATHMVTFLPCYETFLYRLFVLNVFCLHTGISWSIRETASSSSSSLEGQDSSLQKGSSSYAAFPKQASSYSLSSLFKGEVSPVQYGLSRVSTNVLCKFFHCIVPQCIALSSVWSVSLTSMIW